MLAFVVEYHLKELQIPSTSDPRHTLANEGRKERSKCSASRYCQNLFHCLVIIFFYYYDNTDRTNCLSQPSK